MTILHRGMIDTHCHLTDDKYKDIDISLLIKRCYEMGVTQMISVSVNLEDAKKALVISTQYEGVFSTFGIHPSEIVKGTVIDSKTIQSAKELAKNPNLIAIGECGLDYHWKGYINHKEKQIAAFEAQIKLSIELSLPLIIHTRDAHTDTINLLSKYKKAFGVIHCFTGTPQEALDYIDLGFYISFSGVVTFKNAVLVAEAAKVTPLNRILIETDSPYLTPEPYRGEINYPYFVSHVCEKISKIKKITAQEIIQITSFNTGKLFKI